ACGPARSDRRARALSLYVCRNGVRRPQLDNLQRGGALHPDPCTCLFCDPAQHSALADAIGGSHRPPRSRQLRLEHGQYFLFLSRSHQGLGAWLECSWGEYRRQQRAVADAASDWDWPVCANASAQGLYLQNAGLMWLLPLAIAVSGAFLFMNNLT